MTRKNITISGEALEKLHKAKEHFQETLGISLTLNQTVLLLVKLMEEHFG